MSQSHYKTPRRAKAHHVTQHHTIPRHTVLRHATLPLVTPGHTWSHLVTPGHKALSHATSQCAHRTTTGHVTQRYAKSHIVKPCYTTPRHRATLDHFLTVSANQRRHPTLIAIYFFCLPVDRWHIRNWRWCEADRTCPGFGWKYSADPDVAKLQGGDDDPDVIDDADHPKPRLYGSIYCCTLPEEGRKEE